MRNIWKKLTASLLALVLTVQLLPVSALADEFEIDGERHDTFTYEQPDVSGEIPELRGEYEKHFSLSDGTYSAVVYPYAVHYDEDGTWQEIDNTLRAGTEQYTVPAEAGTEYAELMPVELGGGWCPWPTRKMIQRPNLLPQKIPQMQWNHHPRKNLRQRNPSQQRNLWIVATTQR